jgi:hypothetical protein
MSNPLSQRKSNKMPRIPNFPSNVIPFPLRVRRRTDFDRLTVELVMKKFREGTLPEGVVLALLAAVGLRP